MSKLTDETITISRLTSFSDGVFAIAVTLLVFNLKVPQIAEGDVHTLLSDRVLAMVPNFTTYIISFLLIAVYWTFHHRMLNLVTKIDSLFLWMNIGYLLLVSFIPFPAALYGSYPHELFSFIFYIIAMILVNGISMLMLGYASYKSRLVTKELPAAIVKYLFFRLNTTVFVFLLAIPIALYQQRWAVDFLFVLFPINWATKKYYKAIAQIL
ncbi:TMEM175 family protein [Mucilaginibacter sp.]|uniref:TMEM175 family protein n=1 Tax=Mucilaginibacter sp. TaxID=1882438 RepID=UPI00283DACB9|nr:TMEM175 family protein [Mucilaginibacter sp.]MDR3695887.1 TMEM175 family protein [Mucilaginibacter sp.]